MCVRFIHVIVNVSVKYVDSNSKHVNKWRYNISLQSKISVAWLAF